MRGSAGSAERARRRGLRPSGGGPPECRVSECERVCVCVCGGDGLIDVRSGGSVRCYQEWLLHPGPRSGAGPTGRYTGRRLVYQRELRPREEEPGQTDRARFSEGGDVLRASVSLAVNVSLP